MIVIIVPKINYICILIFLSKILKHFTKSFPNHQNHLYRNYSTYVLEVIYTISYPLVSLHLCNLVQQHKLDLFPLYLGCICIFTFHMPANGFLNKDCSCLSFITVGPLSSDALEVTKRQGRAFVWKVLNPRFLLRLRYLFDIQMPTTWPVSRSQLSPILHNHPYCQMHFA